MVPGRPVTVALRRRGGGALRSWCQAVVAVAKLAVTGERGRGGRDRHCHRDGKGSGRQWQDTWLSATPWRACQRAVAGSRGAPQEGAERGRGNFASSLPITPSCAKTTNTWLASTRRRLDHHPAQSLARHAAVHRQSRHRLWHVDPWAALQAL